MSGKDYENYNRSYSSDKYRNHEEVRFGQSSEKRFYQPRDNQEERERTEYRRTQGEFRRGNGNSRIEAPSGAFIFLVAFVIIGGLCFVFLPQIMEATENSRRKNNYFPWNDKKQAEIPNPKSQDELDAEIYGLQEQEYVAIKGLKRDEILERLNAGSFKKEEKTYFAQKAIEDDDRELLGKIINTGYSIDSVDKKGRTLLYLAVRDQKSKCEDFLVNSGANLKIETHDNDTILHVAAKTGNLKMAKLAIMAGIPVDIIGADKRTPLYRAAEGNQRYMSRVLVWAGAVRNPRYADATNDLELDAFFKTGKATWTYLKISDSKSKFRGNQGPDKEEEAIIKWTRVYNLIANGKLSELLKEVPNAKDFANMSKYDLPPACVAAKSGRLEVLKYLFSIGCNIKEIDPESGKSPLHYAAERGYADVLEYLLDTVGIDVDLQDNLNNTALHYSVMAPMPFCTEKLLKAKANPNILNLRLQTPLHVSSVKCNVLGTKMLLANGVDINKQDYTGNTALHYVALKSDIKQMLDVFYEYEEKLDFSIKNYEGKTPAQMQRFNYFKYYEEHYRD